MKAASSEPVPVGGPPGDSKEGIVVVAEGAQLGRTQAKLASDPTAEGGLFVVTSAEHRVGAYVPLKLCNPGTEEVVTTMGRVKRRVSSDESGPLGLELTLPSDDDKLMATLRGWVVSSAAASSSDNGGRKGSSAAGGVAPGGGPQACAEPMLDLDDLLVEYREPDAIPDPDRPERSAEEARQHAQECIDGATVAQRSGRYEDVYRLLEEAIRVYPVNADTMHIRLAELALGPLDKLDWAEEHARAAAVLTPSRPEPHRILNQVKVERHARSKGAKRARDVIDVRQRRAEMSRRLLLVVGALLLVVLATVGWTYWRFFLPHGTPPTSVDPGKMADLLPASQVRVHQEILYITVGKAWDQIEAKRKRQILNQLATRARTTFDARRVVITNDEPRLLGVVDRHGKVTVYQ